MLKNHHIDIISELYQDVEFMNSIELIRNSLSIELKKKGWRLTVIEKKENLMEKIYLTYPKFKKKKIFVYVKQGHFKNYGNYLSNKDLNKVNNKLEKINRCKICNTLLLALYKPKDTVNIRGQELTIKKILRTFNKTILLGQNLILYMCNPADNTNTADNINTQDNISTNNDINQNNKDSLLDIKTHHIFDKSYLINLETTKLGKRRWNQFRKKNFYYPYTTRFNGINGKLYDFQNEIKNNIITTEWDYGKWKNKKSKIISITKGEIGVSLSHYYIWKHIVDYSYNIVLIQEDDSVCDINTDIIVSDLIPNLPSNWDIFLLDFWLHSGNNDTQVNENIWKVKDFVLMNCYIINLKGAYKLLKNLPISKPLDTWLSKLSDKINIYRHNHINKNWDSPKSSLVKQESKKSFIKHTNNW